MPLARIRPFDNVISEAIGRTYKRVGLRYANPVPTFSDLRDELAQWQDEEKMQRAIDEAKLAAVKLRTWTDKGIYSRLFDRHTNIRTDNNWLFFNVEGLSSDAHLETAMSMLSPMRWRGGRRARAVVRASRYSMSAGPCSIRRSWRQRSFSCFERRASGIRASGASRRRSRILLERRLNRGLTVLES